MDDNIEKFFENDEIVFDDELDEITDLCICDTCNNVFPKSCNEKIVKCPCCGIIFN